ncbi:MAG TPA: M20/M25/M40 family metallo-hydrolase [Microvirga sp.]|nr:M20/M25/M40 family metallo-hydrolase [Microvirga sp.]
MTRPDLSARARDWAIWLTEQPSVTGSEGERLLPERLKERIAATPALREAAVWLIPADDALGRACLAVLVRGRGAETVLLTGHFDTVAVEDYGALAPLATQPLALREALLARLATAATPAERRAQADLTSGIFLPGRGLLDMKAGLAAGLAALEAFAADPEREGNLLFVAVPDEEVNSVGARALARAIPGIEATEAIRLVAAVNLDAIADDGDGSEGRSIALGSVGKVLLTAFVVGRSAHACYPLAGLNAAALAGAIAAAVEWSPALADRTGPEAGMPPTLLTLKDGKVHYDVTTPETAFAAWNALTLGRSAEDVLAAFRDTVAEAVETARAALGQRASMLGSEPAVPAVEIIEAGILLGEVMALDADGFGAHGERLAQEGLDLPEQCRRLTAWAWGRTGRSGPAVVIGFGSLPYPAVRLGEGPLARRLAEAVEAARLKAQAASGESLRVIAFFPGISDMSFLGEADTAGVQLIAANTPAWASGVRWSGEVGAIPTVNIGPWGRDYHTPIERLHAPFAFEVLPALVLDTAKEALRREA